MIKALGFSIFLLVLLTATALLYLPEKVSPQAYSGAFASLEAYRSTHPTENPRYLAVVDYSKPSYLKRMAVIDLKTGKQSYYRVAHGKNSGVLYANRFSNTPESNMSSLGLYKVLEAYFGDHGKAMRLEGLEQRLNGNAFSRDIVLHSADYVSLSYILLNTLTFEGPRIGRSNGCFVVHPGDIDEIIEKLREGGFLFAWSTTQ
ncbi:MAG: murein L,D-transpeptidase catalytic domain family protein [Chlorobiaceae bacterium]|nr:murein L,D-transpeptidase catalytic domain family protein [Chlorobiaceae bacterium]